MRSISGHESGGLVLLVALANVARATTTNITASGDPCASLQPFSTAQELSRQVAVDGIPVFVPSQLLQCLESTLFQEEIRDNVMGAVTAMYELAVFQYNQLGDPDPRLNQGIDVVAEFERINCTDYESDYEFQQDLSETLRSLNDGHHYWTSCYSSNFLTQHALPIVALASTHSFSTSPYLFDYFDCDDNEDDRDAEEHGTIHLAPDLPIFAAGSGATELYAYLGINTTFLAGARVIQIDGLPIWLWLDQVGVPSVGEYQDTEHRLNYLFAGYKGGAGGGFERQGGRFITTYQLDRDNVTLEVVPFGGERQEVVVPWYTAYLGTGTVPFNFSSGADLFEKLCHLPPSMSINNGSSTVSPQSTSNIVLPNSISLEWISSIYASCPIDPSATIFQFENDPTTTTAYIGGRDNQFFQLNDTVTGVIYIPTFQPAGDDINSCSIRWILDSIYGLQNMTARGVQKVLIDTTNNPGGSVRLNQVLQRLLTGDELLEENNFDSVIRNADLSNEMVNVYLSDPLASDSDFSPYTYRNDTSLVDLGNSTDYLEPGGYMEINGETLYTSDLLRDSLDLVLQIVQLFNISSEPPFPPENIVFTGNGLCASACSSFTNFMIEYYYATAFVDCARPNRPIEFQTCAGGSTISSSSLYNDADVLGLDPGSLLPQLEVNGTLNMAFRGSLSPNIAPGQFLQYRTYPAQDRYVLNTDQYLDPITNWGYVASQAWEAC